MSKKTKRKSERSLTAGASPSQIAPAPGSRRVRFYAAALSALVLLGVGYAGTRFEPVRRAVGMRPLLAPAAQQQDSLPLAKEYIYAGGRLVATEEPTPAATPTPTPIGSPPTGLEATATSASVVRLTWTAPAGGVLSYLVERRSGLGAPPEEIATGSASNIFEDTVPTGDHAYLYRVKAVYAGGSSVYGNYDLATTVPFTDQPLQGKVIKADHLKELRRAVRAVRLLAGKGEPTWSHPDPVSTPASQRRAVYLADVTELRTQIDEALTALDASLGVQVFAQPYPTNPALTQYGTVYAAHFEQIRQRVK